MLTDRLGLKDVLASRGRSGRGRGVFFGGLLLFGAGLAMVFLAVLVEDRSEIAVLLVALGSVLMVLGVLVPRLEGPLEVGASGGLKAQIVATAVEKGYPPEEVEKLVALYEQAAEDAAKGRALAAALKAEGDALSDS